MPKAETSLSELLHEIRRIEEHREVLSEKKIRKIYKQLLKELRGVLGDAYTLYAGENGTLTVADLQRNAKLAWYLEEIEKNCNYYLPDVAEEIRDVVEQTYANCYAGMAEAVENSYDLSALNVRPEVMKAAMNNNIEKLILPALLERNRQEVIYQIKQILNIGLMNGERYETMTRRITDSLDTSYKKAKTTVRTKSHRNIEGGFMDCAEHIQEGMEGSDYIYAATWHNMGDERVRPQQRRKTAKGWKTTYSKNGADHIKMEGQTVRAGKLFDLGYYNGQKVQARAPSHSGVAAHDCNCRCFVEYNLMTIEEFEAATKKPVNIASVHSSTKKLMNDNGITDCKLERTTDSQRFSSAIEDARKANPHGGAVDPVSPETAATYKCFIAENDMAGVAIKPDGDITAVFKNSNWQQGGVVNDLIITARANGGVKMDCYGVGLVNMYEKCGYVPVAKVRFNPAFVDDPWLLKTQPDVYFLMKNTDAVEDVIVKNARKAYKLSTQADLDSLPVFDDVIENGETIWGYDRAWAYRDELLAAQNN